MASVTQLNPGGGTSETVFKQIEGTADYYPPATYANLLTFYDNFVIGADAHSGEFIPLTTTSTTWGEQSILFAIGIIPPAANVTGNLLDRSASIAVDAPNSVTGAGSNPGTGNGSTDIRTQIVDLANKAAGLSANKNPAEFNSLLASSNDGKLLSQNYFVSPSISTCALTVRGIWRQAGLDDPKITGPYKIGAAMNDLVTVGQKNGAYHSGGEIASGKYQIQPGDAVIVAPEGSPNSQHAYTVTGVDGGKITSVDGGQKGADGGQQIGNYNRSLTINADGTVTDNNGFSAPRQIVGVVDVSKLPFPSPTAGTSAIGGDATGGPSWQTSGSSNAQAASKEQALTAGSSLLSSSAGQSVTAAQSAVIKATQAAIANMNNCPPLAMMINPQQFSVKGEKIVSDGNWGRNGPIIEFWGDQQDKISASGKVAAFFAMDTQNAGGPGVTRWARNFAASWQNFQSLVQLYRSNGGLFFPDDVIHRLRQTLSMLGSIYIYYDTVLYIGSFDSLNVTETDTAPHTVEYSFEFTVRASFLLDRTDDAFDYGVPQIIPGGSIPFTSAPPVSSIITTQPVPPPYNPLMDNPTAPGANPSLVNSQGQTLQQQIAAAARI